MARSINEYLKSVAGGAVVAGAIYLLLKLSVGPLGSGPLKASILGGSFLTTMDAIVVLAAFVVAAALFLILGQRKEQNNLEVSDKRRPGGIGSGPVKKRDPLKEFLTQRREDAHRLLRDGRKLTQRREDARSLLRDGMKLKQMTPKEKKELLDKIKKLRREQGLRRE